MTDTSKEDQEDLEILPSEETSVSIFDTYANVYINGPIQPETINPIIEFIFQLHADSEEKRVSVVNVFIDTIGGDISSAFKLIETFNMSEIPIRTIGWGKVMSSGLIILMAGTGGRYISENASILSHVATFSSSNFSIKVTDKSHQKEFELITNRILNHYKRFTNQSEKNIKKNLLNDNDVYLSSEDIIRWGMADEPMKKGIEWLKTP